MCTLTALAAVLYPTVTEFVALAMLSTATSFGGGEAYVAVAEGFFVQSGFVEANTYYNQIVATANALPGPILVKIASAIGYVYGESLGGPAFGWLTATVAMASTIGVSSIGALIVLMCFDTLSNSPRLAMIKRHILPVVCGMLLSTVTAMLYEVLKITQHRGYGSFESAAVVVVLFLLMLFAHKKYHVNDVLLLLSGGFVTSVLLIA